MPVNLNLAKNLAGRAPALLRHGRRVPSVSRALPVRAFSSASLNAYTRPSIKPTQSKRLGKVSILRSYSAAATQEAPNLRAYIDSGVIKPSQAVDVKKVLVIGSGGLAIGQAGEFDYSGTSKSLSKNDTIESLERAKS